MNFFHAALGLLTNQPLPEGNVDEFLFALYFNFKVNMKKKG